MRIDFLTGSAEPGRDGVGDYARELAAACNRRGHECRIVAAADSHVRTSVLETQWSRRTPVAVLRLPAGDPWEARVRSARAWLREDPPDWLSLQFVAYAWERKGLIGSVASHILALTRGRRVHVQMHELWIGAEQGARLSHRVVGRLQRRGVLRLLLALDPALVHTTNETFRRRLDAEGVASGVLPLVGNVPLAGPPPSDWLVGEFSAAGVPRPWLEPRERAWWFGVFGTVHAPWPPGGFLEAVAAVARREGRRVLIASVGRQGPGADSWTACAARARAPVAFCALGERSTTEVSWFLGGLDFGISTNPRQLIGKSGSAAAMLDHGLPVLVPRDDVCYPMIPAVALPDGCRATDGDPDGWLTPTTAPPRRRDGMEWLAERFLAALADPQRRVADVAR